MGCKSCKTAIGLNYDYFFLALCPAYRSVPESFLACRFLSAVRDRGKRFAPVAHPVQGDCATGLKPVARPPALFRTPEIVRFNIASNCFMSNLAVFSQPREGSRHGRTKKYGNAIEMRRDATRCRRFPFKGAVFLADPSEHPFLSFDCAVFIS